MELLTSFLLQTEAGPITGMTPLMWVIYSIGGILSLIGVGKIIESFVKAYIARKGKISDAEVVNRGKETEARTDALKIITDRLKSVEARLDMMQDELRAHMETNARLSVENEFLKKENDRLTIEIGELRKETLERAGKVTLLEDHLHKAEAKIETLILKLAGLKPD